MLNQPSNYRGNRASITRSEEREEGEGRKKRVRGRNNDEVKGVRRGKQMRRRIGNEQKRRGKWEKGGDEGAEGEKERRGKEKRSEGERERRVRKGGEAV